MHDGESLVKILLTISRYDLEDAFALTIWQPFPFNWPLLQNFEAAAKHYDWNFEPIYFGKILVLRIQFHTIVSNINKTVTSLLLCNSTMFTHKTKSISVDSMSVGIILRTRFLFNYKITVILWLYNQNMFFFLFIRFTVKSNSGTIRYYNFGK